MKNDVWAGNTRGISLENPFLEKPVIFNLSGTDSSDVYTYDIYVSPYFKYTYKRIGKQNFLLF